MSVQWPTRAEIDARREEMSLEDRKAQYLLEIPFQPVCRKCGVAYGYDQIVPHRDGCEYERSAGVCASDCGWPS